MRSIVWLILSNAVEVLTAVLCLSSVVPRSTLTCPSVREAIPCVQSGKNSPFTARIMLSFRCKSSGRLAFFLAAKAASLSVEDSLAEHRGRLTSKPEVNVN
jgi:hypothetical protein